MVSKSFVIVLGLFAAGLTLIGLGLAIPARPVTTCLTNSYGTFCTEHVLDGTRVVHCGYNADNPNEPRFCIQSSFLNPLPFLLFWTIHIEIVGFLVLVVDAFYAFRHFRAGVFVSPHH